MTDPSKQTPSGATVWVDSGGNRTDVTSAVQALYDLLLSSMDFGSGFLSAEEIMPIADLGEACGFDLTHPRSYLKTLAKHIVRSYEPDRVEAVKAQAWLDAHPEARLR